MPIAHDARSLHCAHAPGAAGGRRVAIAGGGTAGHVHPALAVADAYRAARPDAALVYLGTGAGPEARLVPGSGCRFRAVRGAPFLGVGAAGKLRAAAALVAGLIDARRVLAAEDVELVLGFGGYASAGAVLAGRSLGLPAVVHEANAVAGAANLVLGRVADRVLLGAAGAAGAFAARKTVLTGMPVPADLVAAAAGASRSGPDGRPVRVLVSGGSGGSPFLDARVPDLLARVAARGLALEIDHQSRPEAAAAVGAAYRRAGLRATVRPWIDDMAAAYRWADLAVACAGAATLAELALFGLPALLVPLGTAAGDHQSRNAAAFAAATGAPWVREPAWDAGALAARLAALAASPTALRAASEGMRRAARPDAAREVVAACEALLAGAARRPRLTSAPPR